MTNPVLDQERAEFLKARTTLGQAQLPAWPRQAKDLDLVQLEVDWVRLSTLNHRTRAEQRAEIARTGNASLFADDPLGPAAQAAQYNILRGQDGFSDLKEDLKSRGQQEHAIVTSDGVLINGNRRVAALRSLYFDDDQRGARYVKCLVLPGDATPTELVNLETELQIARDFKQDYGWINEAFLIEELFERENKDFARVATRMHRDVSDVRSLHEKLQQVHQLVDLSSGTRHHIDFNDNESAFDELSKHIKNKQPAEAEAVRSVYFLGTLSNVRYRKLRHLRRPDAASIVRNELDNEPSLKQLLALADGETAQASTTDILDDVLGDAAEAGPLTPLLSLLARKKPDETLVLGDGNEVDVQDVLESLQSAITAAADEAEEDQRDQAAQTTPLARADKAIAELDRALAALPKARTFSGFDETGMAQRVTRLQELLNQYPGTTP
ncbi:ParB/RepB/Spo0J family partition protein [Streptomyces sp. SID13031]|uniref:ParB/RepB/Spo0J family partition protein n=1 Tax=Streptomyces sp. SID13031 TaxID=2706046 RepID=UPI0013C9FFFF|nr:ParB/RepB/Spo0J family partition protein [Streptomyces sp. SID13031]NEA30118.1 hypothetical protein [Streptomyces sp. SID13031]